MRASLIFSLLIAVIAVIFALLNPDPIEVNLLFFETQGSAALILIITFVLGVIVGMLSMLPGRIRSRKRLKALEEQLSKGSTDSPGSSGSAGASGSSPSVADMPDVSPPSSSSS